MDVRTWTLVAAALAAAACGDGKAPKGGSASGSASVSGRTPDNGVAASGSRSADSSLPAIVPEDTAPAASNVLIVTIDTLRADHLGFMGYFRDTSPNLDALARESVVFERAFAPIATTLPSHTTMFTGVAPHEHGVLANIAGGRTYERRSELITLAEFLQSQGYATAAVVSATPLKPEFGLDAGFDSYDAPKRRSRTAEKSIDVAIERLEHLASLEGPGFLWVHLFDPHGPYNPPIAYAGRYQSDAASRAYQEERAFAERAQRPTGEWNELELGLNSYDAEIFFTDHELGRLLTRAEELGWGKSAITVVAADHGEGLNQHGAAGHGLVWEEQLHVPFLVRAPGTTPARVSALMGLDGMIAALLHLVPFKGEAQLLAQTTGTNPFRPDPDQRLLGQTSPRQSATGAIGYSLRAGRWKFHREESGTEKLFDLERDPFELENIVLEKPRVTAAMGKELDQILAHQKGEIVIREASEATRSDLKALGYGGR